MINIIRKWCENLLVVVCISIIIEMLAPNGNNKKYIKVVIGIYIIFVTINPIFEIINYKISFDEFNNIELSSIHDISLDERIKNTYISAIEESLKKEIVDLGFDVESVKIITDKDFEKIEKVELSVKGKKERGIEPIVIGKEPKEEIEYNEIEEYLYKNYSINKENILFK